MSWAVGYDSKWKRDIGYGVPAKCDHPGCDAEIDRGLGYVCGDDVYGGVDGCGLFFCGKHLFPMLCERCMKEEEPFEPTPDVQRWIEWKATDPSWEDWRNEQTRIKHDQL